MKKAIIFIYYVLKTNKYALKSILKFHEICKNSVTEFRTNVKKVLKTV